jgi:hypothetical protein
MKILISRLSVVMLLAFLAVISVGQNEERTSFQQRGDYEEAHFGGGDVTIKTRAGTKNLHVSLSTVRVAQTEKPATLRWSSHGLALLQHATGAKNITVGKESFEPLESEWLRVPLPAEFSIGTDNNTVLLDVILIEER